MGGEGGFMAGLVLVELRKCYWGILYVYHSTGCCSHILHKCKIARLCSDVCPLSGVSESALCCVCSYLVDLIHNDY